MIIPSWAKHPIKALRGDLQTATPTDPPPKPKYVERNGGLHLEGGTPPASVPPMAKPAAAAPPPVAPPTPIDLTAPPKIEDPFPARRDLVAALQRSNAVQVKNASNLLSASETYGLELAKQLDEPFKAKIRDPKTSVGTTWTSKPVALPDDDGAAEEIAKAWFLDRRLGLGGGGWVLKFSDATDVTNLPTELVLASGIKSKAVYKRATILFGFK